MADVLSSIPGLAGYLAMEDRRRAGALGDLHATSGLLGLLQKQQEAERAAQMMPLQRQLMEAQVADANRKATATQAMDTAIAQLPTAQQAFARLAPQAFVSGQMRALNPDAGVPTLLAKALRDAQEAESRGDAQTAQMHRDYARRIAAGFTPLQEGRYQGFDYDNTIARNRAVDEGVPVPPPGRQPVPGATTAAPPATGVDFGTTGRAPESARQRVLQQELDAAIARGDASTADTIRKEMGITDYSGRQPTGAALPPRAQREIDVASKKQMFELNSKQYNELRNKIPELNSSIRSLERLQGLIDKGNTFSNSGAEFKMQLSSLAQALGVDVNVRKLADSEEYQAQVAELLKARLGSKDYGSGTGVSNLDLVAAGQPLPQLVKSKEGQKQIIQALLADATERRSDINAFRQHFEANRGDMNGFKFPSEAITEQRIAALRKLDESKSNPRMSSGRVRVGGQVAAPDGVDPQLWNVMTPQEKALWTQ